MEDHKISQPRFVTHESLFWTKLIRERALVRARPGWARDKGRVKLQASTCGVRSVPCVPPFPELTTALTML